MVSCCFGRLVGKGEDSRKAADAGRGIEQWQHGTQRLTRVFPVYRWLVRTLITPENYFTRCSALWAQGERRT